MSPRTRSVTAAAIVAVIFGLLTIFSGGRALFGGPKWALLCPSCFGSTSSPGSPTSSRVLAFGIAQAGQPAFRSSSHWQPQPSSPPSSGRSGAGHHTKRGPWGPWGFALPPGWQSRSSRSEAVRRAEILAPAALSGTYRGRLITQRIAEFCGFQTNSLDCRSA